MHININLEPISLIYCVHFFLVIEMLFLVVYEIIVYIMSISFIIVSQCSMFITFIAAAFSSLLVEKTHFAEFIHFIYIVTAHVCL